MDTVLEAVQALTEKFDGLSERVQQMEQNASNEREASRSDTVPELVLAGLGVDNPLLGNPIDYLHIGLGVDQPELQVQKGNVVTTRGRSLLQW